MLLLPSDSSVLPGTPSVVDAEMDHTATSQQHDESTSIAGVRPTSFTAKPAGVVIDVIKIPPDDDAPPVLNPQIAAEPTSPQDDGQGSPPSKGPSPLSRSTKDRVISRIRMALRPIMNAKASVKNSRIARVMSQIPFDAEGRVLADAASKVFLACGLTLPEELRMQASHSQSSMPLTPSINMPRVVVTTSQVKGFLNKMTDELNQMDHLDHIVDIDDEASKTVASSRLVISSRIDSLVRRARALSTTAHQALDIVHYFTILFHFTVVTIFSTTFFDTEPVGVYAALWFVWAVWLVDLAFTKLHGIGRFHSGRNTSFSNAETAGSYIAVAIDLLSILPVDMILYFFCEEAKADGVWPFDSKTPILSTFIVFRTLKLLKPIRILWMFQFSASDLITPSFVTFYFLWAPMLRILCLAVVGVQSIITIMMHLQVELYTTARYDTYVNALVQVISMLSGVGPNVTFERTEGIVFDMLLMAVGVFVQAAVISKLVVTVFRNDVSAMNVEAMRETLNILVHFRVPEDVSSEILSFQLHTLSDDVSGRLSTLETLPISMQREVLLYVKVAAVNTVKLFTKATHDCKMKIAELLVQTVVSPMTDIVSIGDFGREMFLIAHGYATVIIATGMTVAMLSRGDYFGEVALLLPNNIRQATVRALTYCDLWVLDKESFVLILKKFPGLLIAMKDEMLAKGIDPAALKAIADVVRNDDPEDSYLGDSKPATTTAPEIGTVDQRRRTQFSSISPPATFLAKSRAMSGVDLNSPINNAVGTSDFLHFVPLHTEQVFANNIPPPLIGAVFDRSMHLLNASSAQQTLVPRRSMRTRVSDDVPIHVASSNHLFPEVSGTMSASTPLVGGAGWSIPEAPLQSMVSPTHLQQRLSGDHPSSPTPREVALADRVAYLESQLSHLSRDVVRLASKLSS
ncbi:cation efflux transmembrane transport protein, putative [Bodo saltans]|uniref:Cation efflux transmembrane transport protein, putative n=1 Tax=Bodo saltans TaxID=75058 RepID=A0A0S4IIA9_BODSA|nr:cation efflux transmembrane transport protein, putative [Bodo saltans]|eukprot:CUE71293.1 cation efflux transmembrane transport protein, putative [Bodo saltans]